MYKGKSYLSEERAEKAMKHNEEMLNEYLPAANCSIAASIVYDEKFKPAPKAVQNSENSAIKLVQTTSDKAIDMFNDTTTCVLNFASYTRPGGGFLSGAMAQEEALCHASNLYNVLSAFKHEYDNNFKRMQEGNERYLYRNWGIFSPDVFFFYCNRINPCDVITVPAPNINKAINEGANIDDTLYKQTLKDRIKFVLDIAAEAHDETVILGAFGCGVFGNDPKLVATYFKELLNSGMYGFKQVIFAIPDDKNFSAFVEIFDEKL